jgi:hypothetical protein
MAKTATSDRALGGPSPRSVRVEDVEALHGSAAGPREGHIENISR